jgi:hypothetical protein
VAAGSSLGGSAVASAQAVDPTCVLDTNNIQVQTPSQQAAISLIVSAQSPNVIKTQYSPYHVFATTNIVRHPGTQAAETTFTGFYGTQHSGSLTAWDNLGNHVVCLGQFAGVSTGGDAANGTLRVPSDRNMITIQNGTGTEALTSVEVQINQGCHFAIPLASGQVYTQDMSNWGGSGVTCLNGPTSSGSPGNNTITIAGDPGSHKAPGQGFAEAVAWGTGPFASQGS